MPLLSGGSTRTSLGPLALAETFQATLARILDLGFWRGLCGSLAVLWMLLGAAVGTVLSIGLYVRQRGGGRRRQDTERERWEGQRKRMFGFTAAAAVGYTRGRSASPGKGGGAGARRVRWVDQEMGGEKGGRGLDLGDLDVLDACGRKVSAGRTVPRLGEHCCACLAAKVD